MAASCFDRTPLRQSLLMHLHGLTYHRNLQQNRIVTEWHPVPMLAFASVNAIKASAFGH